MKLACAIAGHRPVASPVYNSGLWFADCRRCRTGLVRLPRSPWAPPPSGFRIAWKGGNHAHGIAIDYSDVLPVAVETISLPARPGRFASWSRSMVPARSMRLSAVAGSCVLEEEADYRHPLLMLAGAVLAAAMTFAWDVFGAR